MEGLQGVEPCQSRLKAEYLAVQCQALILFELYYFCLDLVVKVRRDMRLMPPVRFIAAVTCSDVVIQLKLIITVFIIHKTIAIVNLNSQVRRIYH